MKLGPQFLCSCRTPLEFHVLSSRKGSCGRWSHAMLSNASCCERSSNQTCMHAFTHEKYVDYDVQTSQIQVPCVVVGVRRVSSETGMTTKAAKTWVAPDSSVDFIFSYSAGKKILFGGAVLTMNWWKSHMLSNREKHDTIRKMVHSSTQVTSSINWYDRQTKNNESEIFVENCIPDEQQQS